MAEQSTSKAIRITTDDELVEHFRGVMIGVSDPLVGGYQVPGWECVHCGWRVGARHYPRAHVCPDEGVQQKEGSR